MTSLLYNFFPTDLLPPNNIHFSSSNTNNIYGNTKIVTTSPTSQQQLPPAVLVVVQPTQQKAGDHQASRSIKLDEHTHHQLTPVVALRNSNKKKKIQHVNPPSYFMNSIHRSF
ncbi:hypothetical protein BVC80_8979g21 [Macleaya cordata]|uniref:Uncharacterized protein n=1 Tax=Macleaya cordata TaxID=56857 RepID=A0A200QMH9_MACCD|nr:hypothetical protein BVC80_8979g21 [Macleaya cordata]